MSVESLCAVDVSAVAAWIATIPFEEWPQQNSPAIRELKPAMVTDLRWHGFGEQTDALVESLLATGERATQRMLSVVMPGGWIEPHRDAAQPGWTHRVHVPLLSNPDAVFISDGIRHVMQVGTAYRVDIRALHEVVNAGDTPRIHLMFDVLST